MTIAENKRIIRRYIEAPNTGKVDNLHDLISPDYVETLDPEKKMIGVEGAREHITGVRKTFPDLHLTIEKQIA
jgi:predicted ester cyclase